MYYLFKCNVTYFDLTEYLFTVNSILKMFDYKIRAKLKINSEHMSKNRKKI